MVTHKNNQGKTKRARRVTSSERKPEHTKKKAYWMYGLHSVAAALLNKKRHCSCLLVTREAFATLQSLLLTMASVDTQRITTPALSVAANMPPMEIVTRDRIEALFPPKSAHQSIALLCQPLENPSLVELLANDVCSDLNKSRIVVLDRAQDPRNIGAVLRSACFFGVKAVLLANAHTPNENAVMAKAASGALEVIPVLRLNIAQALRRLGGKNRANDACGKSDNETLGSDTWIRIALEDASHGAENWREQSKNLRAITKIVLVFGAEDVGIRPLVRSQCDISLSLENPAATKTKTERGESECQHLDTTSPLTSHMKSLNLSNAVTATLALLAR